MIPVPWLRPGSIRLFSDTDSSTGLACTTRLSHACPLSQYSQTPTTEISHRKLDEPGVSVGSSGASPTPPTDRDRAKFGPHAYCTYATSHDDRRVNHEYSGKAVGIYLYKLD